MHISAKIVILKQ